MNEQEQTSQLSALFDGELPASQAEMVIRRALRDPSMRASWERYALIGACMRNEPFRAPADHAGVADRVRLRLAAEPAVAGENGAAAQSPRAAAARSWLLGRGAVGGAIAASVALVSILVFRSVAPEAGGTDAAQRMLAAAGGETEAVMPSYTTPVDTAAGMQRVPAPLFKYVVAHSEVASSMLRSSYDLAQGAEEMTEAEIKDYR